MHIVFDVELKTYRRNEVIFSQDEEGDEAYFVAEGEVNISIGKFDKTSALKGYSNFKNVATYSKGKLFGEMSAVTGEKRSARAIATSVNTVLLCFKIVDEITEKNAKIFIKVYKEIVDELSKKLRKTNEVALNKKNK